MKALVAVKRVLDYNLKARVKTDKSGIDLTNQKMSMNPFDEIAVEEAVRLKETGKVAEIIAVSMGTTACQETIRSALALGADRGILVETDQVIEPLTAAKILQKICEKEGIDMAILGKQAIDDDANQTGQMLASLLDWPQGTFISELNLDDQKATVLREIDGGLERITCELPAVFTTDLRLNVPRYPKLPNIMKAKKKPLDTTTPEDLGITVHQSQTTLEVNEPQERSAGILVPSVDELVERLHNEAKVI